MNKPPIIGTKLLYELSWLCQNRRSGIINGSRGVYPAENDGATILPVILKPCRFGKNKKLSVFQAVNNPAKPLSSLSEAEQDKELLKLVDRVADLIEETE